LEAEVLTLTRQLEQQRPQLSAWSTGRTAAIEQIRPHLCGATIVEFYVAQGYIHAFVIGPQALHHYDRLISVDTAHDLQQHISAAINRALDLAAQYGPDVFNRYLPALLADVNTHLARLYEAVLQPVLQSLPTDAPLIFSPDGPLQGVPFHAAFDGQRYLIESRPVSYSPSATVLELSGARVSQQHRSVIAGYSGQRLKHIEAEVSAVSEILPEAECFREQAATTAALLDRLPQARLAHLAAHAQFRLDQPMLSSVGLADRRLTLSEIARLPLNAELITLSGCETGVGQLRGADLLSLAAGFLGAGAQSLVVSLWRVDDASTAELMRTFYRRLIQPQADRARALQSAQLHLLNLGRDQSGAHSAYRHPAYWAPFILIGDPGRRAT
jgi:CHAT domain-containing protein